MRQVIYILLVMNIGYFSWNVLRNPPHAEDRYLAGRVSTKVRQLETLQEKVSKTAAAPQGVRDAGGGGREIASSQGSAEVRKVADARGNRASQMQITAKPEATVVRGVEALTASEPPGAIAPASSCHSLGPFRDAKDMKAIENGLNRLGYQPKERTGEARVQIGYWVYLPAMEREEAVRITHMLDKRNDHDYLIVKDNVISLGAYDSRTRADVRVAMLRKYGLAPVVEPRHGTRAAYWLDLDLPGDGRAVMKTIRDEYRDVQVQESACL